MATATDSDPEALRLEGRLPVRALNAGLFISRGRGIHATRVIDSHELIVVHSGRLDMREDGREFAVEAGQALILLPGRRHGGARPYQPDLSFFWLHFEVPALRGGRRGAAAGGQWRLDVPRHLTLARPEVMNQLFRRFLDDQESGRLAPPTADLLVALMLAEVADSAAPRAAEPHTALAELAQAFIRTHYHEPISTAAVAAALRCNPDYLGRVFRAAFGVTPTEAIHERRLRHAVNLLQDSALRIDEIARECGFPDAGHFRSVFRRAQGVSPRAWRRLHARVHIVAD